MLSTEISSDKVIPFIHLFISSRSFIYPSVFSATIRRNKCHKFLYETRVKVSFESFRQIWRAFPSSRSILQRWNIRQLETITYPINSYIRKENKWPSKCRRSIMISSINFVKFCKSCLIGTKTNCALKIFILRKKIVLREIKNK